MTNIRPKYRLDAIDVLRLPEDDALLWLKENSFPDAPILSSRPEEKLHRIVSFAYSKRGSKRVRQTVARYGSHPRTLKKLFNDGTRSERLAVLSNPFIGPQDENALFSSDYVLSKSDANAILQNYKLKAREFAVFASNPHIDREWLAEIISGWPKTDALDNDGLLFLVHYLVDNPIISASRDETLMDGYADYSFGRLSFALADLLQTVPITTSWANVLSKLLEKLYLSHVPSFDVDLIERWKDPEPSDKGERFSFLYLREQITRYIIVRDHRSETKEKYSIDHDDPAVRKGFYSSLPPYQLFNKIIRLHDFSYPSFRNLDDTNISESQKKFVDFCKKCFMRDKNDFVEGLIWNDNFWETNEDRRFLNDIAWSLAEDPRSSMNVPNLYNAREQYHLENNPSFFKDDDPVDVPLEDTVDGKLSRLQEELNNLQDVIKLQSLEDLADQQRAYFESIIEDTQNQIRCLSDKMNDNNYELTRTIVSLSPSQQLNKLENRIRLQGRLIWLIIIVTVAVGYLIAI